jgi:tRNA-specific 2-thiouridylase
MPLVADAVIRYRATPQPARVSAVGGGRFVVRFEAPVRAVVPGQVAVLYSGDAVIGGGTIVEALSEEASGEPRASSNEVPCAP